jgi:O-antigen ligase
LSSARPVFVAYLLLIVCLPLTRPAVFHVGEQPVLLADLLLVAVYALWAREWLRRRVRFHFDACVAAALVYIAALTLSSLVGGTLLSTNGIKLGAYTLLVLLPCLSERCVENEAQARLVVRAWLWGLLLALGIGLAGLVGFYLDRAGIGTTLMCGYGGVKSGNYPRLCAPFRHPNMFANYVGAALPLLVAFGRAAFGRTAAWCLLLLSGVVVAFTISAGLGGFALAFAGMGWVIRRRAGRPWGLADFGLGFAAVAVALLMISVSIGTFVPAGRGHVPLGSKDLLLMDGARPSIWRGVMPTLREHPWLGLGYGTRVSATTDPRSFMSVDRLARERPPAVVPPHRMEAHDTWLNVAGQSGLIGLAAFLYLLYRFVRRFRNGARSPELDLVRIAAGIGLVASVGYSGLVASIEEARHIWALAGLLLVATKPDTLARSWTPGA